MTLRQMFARAGGGFEGGAAGRTWAPEGGDANGDRIGPKVDGPDDGTEGTLRDGGALDGTDGDATGVGTAANRAEADAGTAGCAAGVACRWAAACANDDCGAAGAWLVVPSKSSQVLYRRN